MDYDIKREIVSLEELHANKGQVEGLPANPCQIRGEKFRKLVRSLKDDPEMMGIRELIVYDSGDKRGYVINWNTHSRKRPI